MDPESLHLSVLTTAALAECSDEELLLRYRDTTDQDAFAELVRRYERELYSYLCRYLRSTSLAEEVFQATFLRVHEKARLYEEGRSFRPWIYSIATHQAIDALRRAGRHRTVSLDTAKDEIEMDGGTLLGLLAKHEPGPLAQVEEAERSDWARQAVHQLPDALREVVLLVYFQGLKYREAAEILGIPIGTVKSRVHLAIHELNAAWRRTHPSLIRESRHVG